MNNPTKTRTQPVLPQNMLVTWRERMGYSREDACTSLGCAMPQLVRWESGEYSIPAYIGLACAALALGMKPYSEEAIYKG